jgi:adenine C2-methylase RlmN of 23S rRNA A2503 and tRNA A37
MDININPNSIGRSIVRIFYSLHKVMNREMIIPGGMPGAPISNLEELDQFSKWYGNDIILHHMFIEGINDDESELEQIKLLLTNVIPGAELRILRFNECKGSSYKESSRFDELVKLCAKNLPKVKYQISAGSEIKAACGQFLCLTNRKNVL